MKSYLLLALAAATLLLGGCDTLDRTQYQVAAPSQDGSFRTIVTPADREAIQAVLQPIAVQFKLQDLSDRALNPSIIAYYQQPGRDQPLKLVAWKRDGSVIIDLLQGPSVMAPTDAYLAAREKLAHDLQQAFGQRATIVPPKQIIPLKEK